MITLSNTHNIKKCKKCNNKKSKVDLAEEMVVPSSQQNTNYRIDCLVHRGRKRQPTPKTSCFGHLSNKIGKR